MKKDILQDMFIEKDTRAHSFTKQSIYIFVMYIYLSKGVIHYWKVVDLLNIFAKRQQFSLHLQLCTLVEQSYNFGCTVAAKLIIKKASQHSCSGMKKYNIQRISSYHLMFKGPITHCGFSSHPAAITCKVPVTLVGGGGGFPNSHSYQFFTNTSLFTTYL